MRAHRGIVLAFVVLFASAPAFAEQSSTSKSEPSSKMVYTDVQLKTVLEHELARAGIKGVSVSVSGGRVTLVGKEENLWEKREASRIAFDQSEVVSVANELSVAGGESDEQIAADVSRRLRSYVFYTIYDNVDLSVNDGVVRLTGAVTMPYKSEEMARLASKVPGVQDVENDLRTLPTSAMDDELRVTLARRIYGDPMFEAYASQAVPPIHIVVEGGRVTLAGAVSSEVERRAAENIARSTFGVFSVDDRLTVSST
jgi:hyperosmotically inducible protein